VLGRYSSSCKVKLTVQRAAPPLAQMVGEDDDQLITPPSVVKIITGQVGGNPGLIHFHRSKFLQFIV
jgi:hypothetical protein